MKFYDVNNNEIKIGSVLQCLTDFEDGVNPENCSCGIVGTFDIQERDGEYQVHAIMDSEDKTYYPTAFNRVIIHENSSENRWLNVEHVDLLLSTKHIFDHEITGSFKKPADFPHITRIPFIRNYKCAIEGKNPYESFKDLTANVSEYRFVKVSE